MSDRPPHSGDPIILDLGEAGPLDATGESFGLHVWTGSGPPQLHVHHADDEAWLVLEGTLQFRFADRTVFAPAGTLVFAPAGTPHTFEAQEGSRYALVLTPRLRALVAALHHAPTREAQVEVYRRHDSELLE